MTFEPVPADVAGTVRGFGARLRFVRESEDLSLWKLGLVLGISHSTIHRFEEEEAMPSGRVLAKYRQHMNASADWILYGEER